MLRVLCLLCLFFVQAVWSSADILKSPNDSRLYRHLALDNGLKVLLVHDQVTEKAAAALHVGVGSLDNPKETQGLAHFLEHMLFLGTKKFPKENEYAEYIEKNGGSRNAFTGLNRTVYYFDILPKHFEGGIDRFAQFFISPLFNAELVDREKNAVESEYNTYKKNDMRTAFQVIQANSNPAHPISQFHVGNLDTLKASNNLSLRDKVIQFYHEKYRPDLMTLVLVGPQSLDELERMSRQYFSDITKHKTAYSVPDYLHIPIFESKQLQREILAKPNGKRQYISLIFPVSEQSQYYHSGPDVYISKLISQSTPGSLYDELYQKHWIESIGSTYERITSTSGIYMIDVDLTPEGISHIDDIVSAIFEYLDAIKTAGIEPWRQDEIIKAQALGFKFKEKSDAISTSIELASKLAQFPPEDVIKAHHVYDAYEPELIKQLLSRLTPENMLLFVSHNQVKGSMIEPYYKTPYTVNTISQKRRQKWIKNSPIKAKLPKVNPYVIDADGIAYKPSKQSQQKPTLVDKVNSRQIWYVNENTFKSPRIFVNYTLNSRQSTESLKNLMASGIFNELVNQALDREFYQARAAGNMVAFDHHTRGFTVSLGGFDSGILTDIAHDLNRFIKDFTIDKARFEIAKNLGLQKLDNLDYVIPVSRGLKDLRGLLVKSAWTIDEQKQGLSDLTYQDLQTFVKRFFEKIQFEMLIAGNIDEPQVVKMGQNISTDFNIADDDFETIDFKVAKLLGGQTYVRNVPTKHSDHSLVMLYQPEDNDDDNIVTIGLLQNILHEKFFQELRTKNQLGYIVGVAEVPFEDVSFLAYYVESATHAPSDLFKHYDNFQKQTLAFLTQFNEADLQPYKETFRDLILKKPVNIFEWRSRFWTEIVQQNYRFNRREVMASKLMGITPKRLLASYHALHQNAKTTKRIIFRTNKLEESVFGEYALLSDSGMVKTGGDFYAIRPKKANG